MEKLTEGQEPEANKFLPIRTAYEQIAVWLGTTVEEIEKKFYWYDIFYDVKFFEEFLSLTLNNTFKKHQNLSRKEVNESVGFNLQSIKRERLQTSTFTLRKWYWNKFVLVK